MSLSGYINTIDERIAILRKDVHALQQENRELKNMLTHAHHRFWTSSKAGEMKTTEEMIEDLIISSNQPDYLKYR